MRIRVLFFGVLKDFVGCSTETVDLPEGALLEELLSGYSEKFPGVREMLPSVALSVNQEYAAGKRVLRSGDEVALLPPVSGGLAESGVVTGEGSSVRIVRDPIVTQTVLEKLKLPEDGAAVVFEGVVRNNTRERKTLYLDYESYEEMALKQMAELVREARSKFPIREAAIIHRLGKLKIGETSVLIVVASAHRGPAFDACRWIIDTLKKTVPIWKKEYFEDGAVWADGEPFPQEIPRAGGTIGP